MFGRYANSKSGIAGSQSITYSVPYTERVTVADLASFGNIAYLPIVETFAGADSPVPAWATSASITEGFTASELDLATRSSYFTVTENTTNSDAETATLATSPTITEALTSLDSPTTQSQFSLSALENTTVAEDLEILTWQLVKDYAPANWVVIDDAQ